MTDQRLREELRNIAERAPTVEVPRDLYARGRRATMTGRALAVGGAVACLAVVIGLAVTLSRPGGAVVSPAGSDATPAVPDHIYVASAASGGPDVITPVASVSRVVAAYITFDPGDGPRAVLIEPDGSYHIVLLPGLRRGLGTGTSAAFALSPDGRQIAYYSRTGHRARRTAITVVRFGTHGAHRVIRTAVGGRAGAVVDTLSWSQNGRWLVWDGRTVRSWSTPLQLSRSDVAGRIRIGHADTRLPTLRDGWHGAGICDDGSVVQTNDAGTWRYRPLPAPLPALPVRLVAPSKWWTTDATFCHRSTPVGLSERNFPYGESLALGLTADGIPVAAGVPPTGRDDWQRVYLVGTSIRQVSEVVGADESQFEPYLLTVATGLMTSAHPTVSLPRPPWAPAPVRWWVWALAAAGLVALAGLLAASVRRLWAGSQSRRSAR